MREQEMRVFSPGSGARGCHAHWRRGRLRAAAGSVSPGWPTALGPRESREGPLQGGAVRPAVWHPQQCALGLVSRVPPLLCLQCALRVLTLLHVSCFSYLYKNEIQSIDRQAFTGLASLEQL